MPLTSARKWRDSVFERDAMRSEIESHGFSAGIGSYTPSERVVASARSVDGGQQALARIRAAGAEPTFVRAGVSSPSEVAALVQAAVDTYGTLDCAHNNAGVSGAGFLAHEYPD